MSEKRYAILIGNGAYEFKQDNLPDLRCPVNDINALSEVLGNPERGQFDRVEVLPDCAAHDINLKTQELLNSANASDLIVIFYSGHGKQNRSGQLFLAASNTQLKVLDSTAVAVASIRGFIDESPCKRVILILDCCFSGAAGESFSRKGAGVDDQLQLASQGSGTYLITASTSVQAAFENDDDQYSVFTKHMVDGLDSGRADLAGNGVITIGELYNYVHDALAEDSSQVPTKWGMNVRGEIVIAKSGREPRKERAVAIRSLLLDLAREERIPVNVLSRAVEILKRPYTELSGPDRQRDDLLSKLQQRAISPAGFLVSWTEMTNEAPAKQKVARQPAPSPRPVTAPQPAPMPFVDTATESRSQKIGSPQAHIRKLAEPYTHAGKIKNRQVFVAVLFCILGWAGALSLAAANAYHPLLFEDSGYTTSNYLQANRFRSHPNEELSVIGFAAAGTLATLMLVAFLWRFHPRFRFARSLLMVVGAIAGWSLVGVGAAMPGSENTILIPIYGVVACGACFMLAMWRPRPILHAGWLLPLFFLWILTSIFGLAIMSASAGQEEIMIIAAAVYGLLIALVFAFPLVVLTKRAALKQYSRK